MSTNSTAFIGTWTNWSQGQILGATLTLHSSNADILIAALAMFVGLAGAKSWSILCFVIHQLGVTRRPQNGAYHQLQVALRNNGGDLGTIWEALKIACTWSTWRSPRSRSFRKLLGIVVLGLFHVVLFAAAGLLASRFTTLGNEVLVRSPNCGQWSPDFIANSSDPTRALFDYSTHLSDNAELALQYFQDCMSRSQSSAEIQSSTECNVFKTLALPYTTTENVPCPFSGDMCLSSTNGSVTFDTGLIDSAIHLGINSAKKHRVQLRKAMTCSPITTQGYIQDANVTLLDGRVINFTAALYGPQFSPNALPGIQSLLVANSTTLIEKQNPDAFPSRGNQFYTFNAETAFPVDTDLGFVPIPPLDLQDQTVTLIFVAYVGYYLTPSNDLWLPAHQAIITPSLTPNGTDMNITTYSLDNDINVLSCTEQLQFCNPSRSQGEVQCTPMLPLNILEDWYINATDSGYLAAVFDNAEQMLTASQITYALDWAHLRELLRAFNEPPLLLYSLQQQSASLGLAEDQWILESSHLFALTLNTLQRYITEFATGPPAPYSQYTAGWLEENPSSTFLCENQIIRSPNFTSFSILGISIIFGLGGVIIVVSLSLESVVSALQKRYGSVSGALRRVRWRLDGKLQLQRMALEEAGLGRWMGGGEQVPITVERGEKITLPAEWDEVHPSFCLSVEKGRSTRSGSVATLVNEVAEVGEDARMLLKEKKGYRF